MTKDEALGIAVDYVHAALISHDNAYGNHPAMKRERDEIVRDLEAIRQALAEPPPDQRANLIAAAPDLLEALEELFYLIDESHDNERIFTCDIQKKCRAAIAKAIGEPPPDQLPDTTKMIDKVCIRHWVQDTIESGHWTTTDSMERTTAEILLSGTYGNGFQEGEIVPLPEMPVDRGVWDDVEDATKWVDELRGDEPNTDVAPIGEIVEAHGLIAVSIPEMPPVGTKLYAQPLLNQTCCGCNKSGGYALYCGWCWSKFNKS